MHKVRRRRPLPPPLALVRITATTPIVIDVLDPPDLSRFVAIKYPWCLRAVVDGSDTVARQDQAEAHLASLQHELINTLYIVLFRRLAEGEQ